MNLLRRKILSVFDISLDDLNRLIATAPHRYKVFYIPKKQKGQMREIAQPASELKIIQNWLIGYLSDHLPIHHRAVAYRKKKGIKHNALQHVHRRYVLKMDLENFFPSIVKRDIEKHFKLHGGNEFSQDDISDICRLVLWSPKNMPGHRLCIGAPSSPFISNSILNRHDEIIYRRCQQYEVIYTRYADDLIFSTNQANVLSLIESFVKKVFQEADYPKLSINKEKTIHTSRGRGITVTGVVITSTGKLSIGRNRKRLIRATIHHFLTKKLSIEEVQKLNGLLAFSLDIEPEFVQNMKIKYGEDILYKIQSYLSQNAPIN